MSDRLTYDAWIESVRRILAATNRTHVWNEIGAISYWLEGVDPAVAVDRMVDDDLLAVASSAGLRIGA